MVYEQGMPRNPFMGWLQPLDHGEHLDSFMELHGKLALALNPKPFKLQATIALKWLSIGLCCPLDEGATWLGMVGHVG